VKSNQNSEQEILMGSTGQWLQ